MPSDDGHLDVLDPSNSSAPRAASCGHVVEALPPRGWPAAAACEPEPSDQVAALLIAGLCDSDNPGAVLVRSRLHAEMLVEIGQVIIDRRPRNDWRLTHIPEPALATLKDWDASET
jgi:hypothetical protein